MLSSAPQPKMVEKAIPFTTNGTVLLHIDFLLTGIVMTFLGPMLPVLSARWAITDDKSGVLIFVQFLASMFGMLLSSTLVQRFGYRITLMIGLVLMSAGMILLASGPYLAGILSVGILGFGYGVTTPAGNLRTAEIDPERSASALSVINAVWGIGAMSSSFLLAAALRAHRPASFLYGTASTLLALLFVLALSRFVPDSRAPAVSANSSSNRASTARILPLICALFFVYVGTETSFGAWIATYAHRLSPAEHTFWAVIPSFFWGAMLVGRALAPLALKYKRATSVAVGGLTLALLGGGALLAAHGIELVIAGAVLAGLGLASIFPISVSLLPNWFGDYARRASGPVFSSGNLGGAVLPLIVGKVSEQSGNLRLAFFVPFIAVISMLTFYVALNAVPDLLSRPQPEELSG